MNILYGEILPCCISYPSLYEYFANHVIKNEAHKNRKAFITSEGSLSIKDFVIMVDSLSLWLYNKLTVISGNTSSTLNKSFSCFSVIFKDFGKKNLKLTEPIDNKELVIGICLKRSPELVALILAVWKLHLFFVPIHPMIPYARTTKVLIDSKPIVIIGDRHTLSGLKEITEDISSKRSREDESLNLNNEYDEVLKNSRNKSEYNILDLEEWKLNFYESALAINAKQNYTANNLLHQFKINCSCIDSVACVVYTSGSSGTPRGVKLTTNNFLNRIHWQLKCYPYDEDDVCIWSKSYTFIDSFTELLCPLFAGVTIVLMKEASSNPEQLIKYITNYNVTRLVLVPSLLNLIIIYLNSNKNMIQVLRKSIRLWISSGEALPMWLLKNFLEIFPESKIANFYGTTETTGDVTHNLLNIDTSKSIIGVPLGLPIYNTAVFIFHNEGTSLKILQEDCVGEIGIIGLNIGHGYIKENRKSDDLSKFFTLNSLYFQDKEEAKNLHNYLNDINYFTGERYGIMEQTFSSSTRNIQQSYLHYKQYNTSPERTRKGSTLSRHSLDSKTLLSNHEIGRISRPVSIYSGLSSLSNSCIVADEVELLSKFKGIKSFAEAEGLQQTQVLRRASVPSPSDTRKESSNKKDTSQKQRFKPNIKTTAELITTEVNRMTLSSFTEFHSGKNQVGGSELTFPMQLMKQPIQEFSSMSSNFISNMPNSTPELVINTTLNSGSIAALYPLTTTTISQTCYILKQMNSTTKEKLAVYATGDFGKIKNGILYFRGRKDNEIQIKGIRTDISEVNEVIMQSKLVEDHYIIVSRENNENVNEETETEVDYLNKTASSVKADDDCFINEDTTSMADELSVTEEVSSLNSLVVFIVLNKYKTNEVELSDSLLSYLRRYLSEPLIPQLVIFDKLPLLSSGKVDVQKLIQFNQSRKRKTSQQNILYMMKEEPIAMKVLRVICESIGVKKSEHFLNKNFFMIGGTSISSVVTVVRLRQMGFDITLEKFLNAPTLTHIAHDILKAKTRAEVMHLFSGSSQRKSSSSRQEEAELEEETEGIEEKDEYEMEEEKCEVEWMRASDEDEKNGKAKLLTLHPDLPKLLIGGEVESSKEECNSSHTKIIRGIKLKISQLCTTALPKASPDREIAMNLVANSFITRNPLDLALGTSKEAHLQLLRNLWPFLLRQELSFIVRDQLRGIVGVMITTNFFNEPKFDIPDELVPIMTFHRVLETKIRSQIEKEENVTNSWAHNVFLATSTNLDPQDNVRLALHLEKELLKLAAKRGIKGIFTINSNPSNQLICSYYLGYEKRASLPVFSFELDGNLPFKDISKELALIAMTKKLN